MYVCNPMQRGMQRPIYWWNQTTTEQTYGPTQKVALLRSRFRCLFTPKEMARSYEDSNVHILDREDRWFERGVKEAIYVKVEKPSFQRGGGLQHHLSLIYNATLSSLPRRFNNLTSKNNGGSQMLVHRWPVASKEFPCQVWQLLNEDLWRLRC